jgi:hypothetical protein
MAGPSTHLVTFPQGETEIPKTSFPLNVGDDSNVRTPHGHWKIRDVERWIAEYLRIPAGSVMLRDNPNGPVGSLRKKQDG